MNDPPISEHIFYTSGEDAAYTRDSISTLQTEGPAYRLAFQDTDFLLREDLRPTQFQLELLKPELLIAEANIGSTLVMYGSARIPEPDKADAMVEAAGESPQKRIAERLRAKANIMRQPASSVGLRANAIATRMASTILSSARAAGRR